MSNKALAYVSIIILIVLAGGFAFMRMSRNEISGQSESKKMENTESQPENGEPVKNQTEEKPATAAACDRKFDAEKLKTAKVAIKNRQAEISVKGFGNITVAFFDVDAPKTVENFLRLANAGYFDCLTFHRVAKGFVVQGGDPTGTGSGGESAFGGEFADEINPASELYKKGYAKGVLAMANRGPNTNTSQFFILLADAGLPPSYTIFGKVVAGIETVDKIGQVEIIPQLGPTDGKPKEPVVMESVKIIK